MPFEPLPGQCPRRHAFLTRRIAAEPKPAMTPILFYGVPSGCSFGSIVALEWLRQPYHLCRIDMPGQVQGEDYRRLNPLGETPLCAPRRANCSARAWPSSTTWPPRALRRGWASHRAPPASTASTTGWPISTPAFRCLRPALALEHAEGDDGKALRAYGTTKVRQAHQALEQMLSTGPWLLGEQRSSPTPTSPASPAGTITRWSTAASSPGAAAVRAPAGRRRRAVRPRRRSTAAGYQQRWLPRRGAAGRRA